MLWHQDIDPSRIHSEKPFILWRPFIAVWQWLFPPTVAHRDRQSALSRGLALTVLVLLSVGLLATGFLYARPLKQAYKNMRAGSMVKEARQMAENGQYVNAVMKAQEAYQKAPESIEAIRLNFEYFTMLKRDTALYFYDKLKEAAALTSADEQLHVRALMVLGKPKEASEALDLLLRKQQPSEALMKLAEEVWGEREQSKPLLNALKAYSESHPDDHESSLRLAKVQVASSNPVERGEGMERLWKLADVDDSLGLQTLEFMSSITPLPPLDTEKLIKRLKEHPRGNGWHYVTALKLEVTANPARKKEIVMAAAETFKDKKGDKLVPFIRWLVDEREFTQILAVLPEEDAKKNINLLENYLNALTMLGRFEAMEGIIEDPAVEKVLDTTTLAMFRAHLAYVLKKPAEELRTKLLMAKDMAELNGRHSALLRIAQYGEDRGHFDIAEDAYRLTIRALRRTSASPNLERQAFEGLMNACQATRNSEHLLQASQDAVNRWPDDTRFMERNQYVSLLLGKNVEYGLRMALTLLKSQPQDNQRKLNVALAHWRLLDIKQAVESLQHMDLNSLSEGQRAVFAAIAHDGGFREEAAQVVKAISPQAVMLPEEKRCFEKALQ